MLTRLFSAVTVLAVVAVVATPEAQAAPTSPQVIAQSASAPQIDDFSVSSVDRLIPGTELVFTLAGTPGAKASLTITGVATNLPMSEVEPGIYEGRYTIRNKDKLTERTAVRANLQQGKRVNSARLAQPLVANDNQGTAGNRDSGSAGIERFTVEPVARIEPGSELVFSLDGTPGGRATFSIAGVARDIQMSELDPGVYEGRYTVRNQDNFRSSTSVTASLQADGRTYRTRLAQPLIGSSNSSSSGSSQTTLPLVILSPTNNSQVSSGPIEVKGRSAPNTNVSVQVQAVTSLAGLLGVNQNLYNQSVQADSQGNFNFTFQPQLATPGTRYEVSLSASKGELTKDQKLVLIQK